MYKIVLIYNIQTVVIKYVMMKNNIVKILLDLMVLCIIILQISINVLINVVTLSLMLVIYIVHNNHHVLIWLMKQIAYSNNLQC